VELMAARAGRKGLWLQNGNNPVHILLGTGTATTSDWLLAANAQLRLDDFPYEGPVQAISTGGNSTVLVVELT
jgi:hypothetical protein